VLVLSSLLSPLRSAARSAPAQAQYPHRHRFIRRTANYKAQDGGAFEDAQRRPKPSS